VCGVCVCVVCVVCVCVWCVCVCVCGVWCVWCVWCVCVCVRTLLERLKVGAIYRFYGVVNLSAG